MQRVILPVYRDGDLKGYQTRKIFDEDPKPKYLTRAKEKPLFWTSKGLLLSLNNEAVVLVEDILSAIKCSEFVNSIALLTATPKQEVIEWITTQGYKKYYIFLDNDNGAVKKSQIALKNRLSLFGEVRLIKASRDPKEHSYEELERLLT